MTAPESTTDSFFFTADQLPTEAVTSYARAGATEQIVYRDPSTGTYVRLLHMPAGFVSGDRPLKHDFDEVVYVLSGTWQDVGSGVTRGPGTMARFPAGSDHGPFTYPDGATFLEVRHYPKTEG